MYRPFQGTTVNSGHASWSCSSDIGVLPIDFFSSSECGRAVHIGLQRRKLAALRVIRIRFAATLALRMHLASFTPSPSLLRL